MLDNNTSVSNSTIEFAYSGEELSPWTRDRIEACPTAGSGLSAGLCAVAVSLRHDVDEDSGYETIVDLAIERGYTERKARIHAERLRKKWREDVSELQVKPDKVKPNTSRIAQIVIQGSRNGNAARMRELSPVDPAECNADDIVARLFLPDELIYASLDATRMDQGGANTIYEWKQKGWRMHEFAFITPNPLKSKEPQLKPGSQTERYKIPRTDNNILLRRFMIAEFDISPVARDGVTETFWKPLISKWQAQGINTKDAQAVLISHLYCYNSDLALVVDSGGKSLHAWFAPTDKTEYELQKFMRYAISIGADSAITKPSQLFRMPGGTRDNGNHQQIHYCDYAVFPNLQ